MNRLVNMSMYAVVVLIWGTTWIAIKYQTGVVPVENSIFYRFVIASLILFAFLFLAKKLQSLKPIDHLFCLLQGCCLFCFNFYAFYYAALSIESGLLSVIFSVSTIFNVVNNRFWYKVKPTLNTIVGSIIGILGIALVFLPDLTGTNVSQARLLGIGLAVLGTFFFSCGNMITVRHNKYKLSTATTNAWGMFYGATIMLCICLIRLDSFTFDTSFSYLASFFYLVIVGTVIAFALYLGLIARLGANKSAYATVLFPIVALTVSYFFEDYRFTPMAVIGLVLAIVGNVIVFYKPKKTH